MAQNPHITRLSLREASIGDDGGILLCKALETNNSLISLNLHSNNLGPAAFKAIGDLLIKNKTLKELNLTAKYVFFLRSFFCSFFFRLCFLCHWCFQFFSYFNFNCLFFLMFFDWFFTLEITFFFFFFLCWCSCLVFFFSPLLLLIEFIENINLYFLIVGLVRQMEQKNWFNLFA